MRRLKIPTLLGAFITLLDDRLGETIVLPLLPFLLEQFTTSATTLGFLTGTYAISQFAASPLIPSIILAKNSKDKGKVEAHKGK